MLALGRLKEEDCKLMANLNNTGRDPVSYEKIKRLGMQLSDKLHTLPGLDHKPWKNKTEKDAEELRSQIRLDRTHDS